VLCIGSAAIILPLGLYLQRKTVWCCLTRKPGKR
jgi:hypothetical protein